VATLLRLPKPVLNPHAHAKHVRKSLNHDTNSLRRLFKLKRPPALAAAVHVLEAKTELSLLRCEPLIPVPAVPRLLQYRPRIVALKQLDRGRNYALHAGQPLDAGLSKSFSIDVPASTNAERTLFTTPLQ